MPPEEQKTLAELFSGHLDGLLNEAEEKELAGLLNPSAEARAILATFMRLEGGLALRGEARGAVAPLRARPRRWAWAAGVAACVALSAGIALWLVFPSEPPWIATLERVEGTVAISGRGVRSGDPLLSGEGLELSGPRSRASLKFRDGTLLDLAPGTSLERVEESGSGKRVRMTRGSLQAKVTPQPVERPMVFETPHGEGRVLGTTLRIRVDPDAKVGMRLEVEQGKVNLRRLSDSKTVLVESGQFAVAAVGIELAARPLRLTLASRGTFRTNLKSVAGAALSHDGTSLALGGADGTVTVVDAVSGAERVALGRHADAVRWLAFSPDSGTLASGDAQCRVLLWSLPRGERRAEFVAPSLFNGLGPQAMAFSPDCRLLATRSSASVRLWDGATGRALPLELVHPENQPVVHCVAFSPQGLLVSGGRQGRVYLWEVASGRRVAEYHHPVAQVVSAVFSPDGKRLATGGGWGGLPPLIKFWDLGKGVEEPVDDAPLSKGDSVLTAAFSPDGKAFARLDTDGTLRLWNVAERKELTRLPARAGRLSMGFVQGGKMLLLVNQDGTAELWSLEGEIR